MLRSLRLRPSAFLASIACFSLPYGYRRSQVSTEVGNQGILQLTYPPAGLEKNHNTTKNVPMAVNVSEGGPSWLELPSWLAGNGERLDTNTTFSIVFAIDGCLITMVADLSDRAAPEERDLTLKMASQSREKWCLKMLMSGNGEGFLQWISTDGGCGYCGAANLIKGKHLMSFSDKLACFFDQKTMQLNDASQVKCPGTETEISFSLLYGMRKGKSWYEANGYQYVYAQGDMSIRQKLFRELDLDELYENGFTELVQEFLEEKPEGMVMNFIEWLYKEHCEDFDDVIENLDLDELYEESAEMKKFMQC